MYIPSNATRRYKLILLTYSKSVGVNMINSDMRLGELDENLLNKVMLQKNRKPTSHFVEIFTDYVIESVCKWIRSQRTNSFKFIHPSNGCLLNLIMGFNFQHPIEERVQEPTAAPQPQSRLRRRNRNNERRAKMKPESSKLDPLSSKILERMQPNVLYSSEHSRPFKDVHVVFSSCTTVKRERR